MNNDCLIFDHKIKKHKKLNLKSSLPYDQDVAEISLAYIDNLVMDHTPSNLKNIMPQSFVKMLPVPPDLKKDELYTKNTLMNSISLIYDHICQGNKQNMMEMVDALENSCKNVKSVRNKESLTDIDSECYALAI